MAGTVAVGVLVAFDKWDKEPRLKLELNITRYFRNDLTGVLEESVA